MALANAALNTAGTAWTAAYPYLSIHTAGAVTSSASESTAARVSAGWSVSASGVATATNKAFTGGAAGGPAIRVSYWSTATVGTGTFGGSSLLTGDQTFNAAGQYTVDTVTENVTST